MKFLAREGKSASECPYAVKLEETASVQSTDESASLIEESIKQCPAFQGRNASEAATTTTCPFKDAHSQDEIKAAFLKIPTSHYQMDAFTKVLSKLHDAAATGDDDKNAAYHIPGGCPVPQSIKSQMSFRQAIEDLSLAAVMGRMAESLEDKSLLARVDHEEDGSDEFQAPSAAAAANVTPKDQVPSTTHDTGRDTQRQSLSESLKEGTAASHQAAENVHFVSNFIRGEIDRGLYSKLIVALYHVYQRLEIHLQEHGPKYFGSCHFPKELERKNALEEDMDFWNGTTDIPPSPATLDYMKRIDAIAAENPLLLLAHAYTRYLGDLSGGKVLSRVAGRALNLDRQSMEGLAFYQFDNVSSAKLFKDMYRQALDDLPLTAAQIEGLVSEANVAFVLNMRLFEELDVYANVPGAKVRPLSEALAYSDPASWKKKTNSTDECPFLVKSKNTSKTEAVGVSKKGRCPWPFVAFHDPAQFFNDWETWVLAGVVLCVGWSLYVRASS